SRGRRPSLLVLGGVVLTAVAAALAMRNNVWLGMVAALLIADTAAAWIPTQSYSVTFLRILSMTGAVLAVGGIGRLAAASDGRFQILAPKHAIESAAAYAAAHPCTRALADILSVSALLWHHPWMAGRVAFDGRIEVYRPR